MTARQQFIRPHPSIDPNHVARMVRRIADALDAADQHELTSVNSVVADGHPGSYDGDVWATTCVLIADTCEIDSATLRSLARSIERVYQSGLF